MNGAAGHLRDEEEQEPNQQHHDSGEECEIQGD
jgi:hypothetical protein